MNTLSPEGTGAARSGYDVRLVTAPPASYVLCLDPAMFSTSAYFVHARQKKITQRPGVQFAKCGAAAAWRSGELVAMGL